MARQVLALDTPENPVTVADNTAKINANFVEVYASSEQLSTQLQTLSNSVAGKLTKQEADGYYLGKTDFNNYASTIDNEIGQIAAQGILNSEAIELKADLEAGKVKVGQLPDVDIFMNIYNSFEPGTVELGDTGRIKIKGSVSVKLASPVMTFGASTQESNTINLSQVFGADTYVYERYNAGNWDVLNSSANRSFTDSGLVPDTEYSYRTKCKGVGYSDSDYVYGVKKTASESSGGDLIDGFYRMDLILPQRLSAGGNPTLTGNIYIAENGECNTVSPYKLSIGVYSGIVITTNTKATVRVHNGYSLFGSGSYNFQYTDGVLSGSVEITSQPQVGDKVLFLRSSGGEFGFLSIVKTSDNGLTYQTISSQTMQLYNADQWIGFNIQSSGEISNAQISSVLLNPES